MLTGPNEDFGFWTVVLDAEPIPEPRALNEVVARLAGQDTYDVMPGRRGPEIWQRYLLFGRPATFRWPVHTEHQC